MINLLFISFVLILSPVTGAFWSSFYPHNHHHHEVAAHRVVIEFKDNGKVTISQPDDFGSMFNQIKIAASRVFEKTKRFQEHATDAVEKAGENAFGVIRDVGKTIGVVDEGTEGTIKDSVVKLEEWDTVDSPKRICEDIGHNATAKIEEGVEQAVENVKETNLKEVLTRCSTALNDLLSWRSVMGWCYLLGFSSAYGMGVWVTFYSGCVLGKCLPRAMVLNMMNMVYFRAMGCCVGVALIGFVGSQGAKGCLFNNMEMFQGFNLASALVMILINLIFMEPRATKFIAQRIEGTKGDKSVAAEKLKKINAYISTLNVSTMVVLTWHLAYIGQLLQS